MIRALVALLLLVPGVALAQGLDQRVAVSPGGLLQVDLELGEEVRAERVSLEVRSHDADEVWAVADLSGLGSTSVKFRLERDPSSVRIYGRSDGIMSWLFGGPGVRVRVWVPREYSVDLRCTSGPIRVEEIQGSVRARTADADVEVETVEGPVAVRTERGSVRVSDVHGPVDVRVGQEGSIDVRWVQGDVEARTLVGSIRLSNVEGRASLRTTEGELGLRELRGAAEAKTEDGPVFASFASDPQGVIETRLGSVEVRLPEHQGVTLDARTGRGTLSLDGGLEAQGDRKPDEFRGRVNGGGAALRVYSARGSIRVGTR
jgi:hypothetical protein